MIPLVVRWMAWMAAALAAALAGCARLPLTAERPPEDRFADAFVELLPVAALMGHSAERDPRWPLGDRARLVSDAQLSCMRQSLSPAEVRASQRQVARDYAQAHGGTLTADLEVLEDGAARLIGQAMREGAGLPIEGGRAPATTAETRALAAFARDPRYASLREATGLARLAGGEPAPAGQRGKDIASALTVNFLTNAFLRCHIPVKLLY
ncbi:hypothetical protein FVQ98_11105 [Ottowia sp. GY511]|uniref:Lipoprotein n=1 Tax=Ottowia flava TaxID=2675430 RepID=A0ABW4KRZ3_9BURK|nr:hypothetical protein [Ottowia sp. GY511]TXK27855.1 hypothetical protein FVQ98_11105 [Ottowia sp. GY511]